ncbi:MAG: ABC transporter permease [Anaerolineaceae bacterium]|jgi:ABC-2 type transport system permease protein
MGKTWDVARHEFLTAVTRRSFLLTLILVPLIPALLLGGLNLVSKGKNQSIQQLLIKEVSNPLPYGVVDQSGLVKQYPDWLVHGQLTPQTDVESARKATAENRLQGFFIIDQDYLQNGKITVVKPKISYMSNITINPALEQVLQYNLLGQNQALYLKYTNPVQFTLEPIDIATADTRDTENMATFFLPYGVTMFFYVMILLSSSLMLNAISKEKDNRVIEMLLSSIKPIQMFLGKLIGLGSAGILQMVVWFGSATFLLRAAGTSLPSLKDIQIPLSVVLLSIPIYVLGFAIYGSLMAGIGALAPNLREGNQSSFVITIPLIFTIISIAQLIQSPHGSFSIFLSLFPFTSPIAMMTRLVIGNVPIWQIALCISLLALTTVLVLRGVSKLFQTQTLLTGQKFEIRKFFSLMFAKS